MNSSVSWREVPACAGLKPNYYAHSSGLIMSPYGKVMGPHCYNRRYARVSTVRSDGRRCKSNVHRIVCMAFHGAPTAAKPLACHKDGNPMNNAAANLSWGSVQDNSDDKRRHGTMWSKVSARDVLTMRSLMDGGATTKSMASMFGLSTSSVRRIYNRESWPHL